MWDIQVSSIVIIEKNRKIRSSDDPMPLSEENFLNRLFQWLGPHPWHVCVCYLAHYIVRLSEEFEGSSKSRGVLVSCECLSVHLFALSLKVDQGKDHRFVNLRVC